MILSLYKFSLFLVVGLFFAILLKLFNESSLALNSIGIEEILFSTIWSPTSDIKQWGMLWMILSSFLVAFLALLFAVPCGVAIAAGHSVGVFGKNYRFVFDFLKIFNSIPSVVFGLWGLVVVVPIINQISSPGVSTLAAVVVLSLMLVPMIAIDAKQRFDEHAQQYLMSSQSIGLSRITIFSEIMLPSCLKSILSFSILSFGRGIGETVAVMMVCGNVVKAPELLKPIRTLTANIGLEMAYATGVHRSMLYVSGTGVLFTIWLLSLSMFFVTQIINVFGSTYKYYKANYHCST
jgi:phosphate transport system permease protein